MRPAPGCSLPYLIHAVGAPGPGAPLIYLLHGHGGGEWDWIRAGGALEAAGAAVAGGLLPPHHLMLPGVGNTWYVDGPEGPPVASCLLDELMPAVAEHLAADRTRLAVIGLSMGGYGALHLGLKQPERFRFIGAMSPSLCPPGSAFTERQVKVFEGAFGEPFDSRRYAAADPFGMVTRAATAPAPPFIYLACGQDDELGLATGTRAFGRALAEAGMPAVVRIVPGHHDWAFWRAELPQALAAVSHALAFA